MGYGKAREHNVDALFRCGPGCGILTAFRASSQLQSHIFRCSSVVRVSRLTCTNSAGICVEPRAKQEKRSVLLRLLYPFLGVFLSVFFTLSLAKISHLGSCLPSPGSRQTEGRGNPAFFLCCHCLGTICSVEHLSTTKHLSYSRIINYNHTKDVFYNQ